ncbi:WhiB family transcriptional regulator [Streptomyces sp. NPDC057257]|uniref:WhiB family transcriptional regulator n=1 Tax=Streptomyces sp. NPDC057257 TaxID=3346071 RepID=UPI00363631C5
MSSRAPNTLDTALSWAERAVCRGRDVNEFFTTDRRRVQQIKNLCDSCPVKQSCLAEAMRAEDGARHGIFGGLTAAERTELAGRR